MIRRSEVAQTESGSSEARIDAMFNRVRRRLTIDAAVIIGGATGFLLLMKYLGCR